MQGVMKKACSIVLILSSLIFVNAAFADDKGTIGVAAAVAEDKGTIGDKASAGDKGTIGKGTIGLVCIDEHGETRTSLAMDVKEREEFDICMRNVVEKWEIDRLADGRTDLRTFNFGDWVGGWKSFREVTETMRYRKLYGPNATAPQSE